MSYIQFDKTQLVNLGYSLSKEIIRSNKSGSYASSTIIGCNTKRFHGLLVVPQPQIGGVHVIISSLDDTVIVNRASYDLGVHKYPGNYSPKGYIYLRDYVAEPVPKLTYRLGDVVLTKEKLLVEHESRTLVRYVVEEAKSPVTLRLHPFLAFRSVTELKRANRDIDQRYEKIDQGIKIRLYPGYDELYMQLSENAQFVHKSLWYYNIEYPEDMELGLDYQEDLYVPGYFEVTLHKGETVIFTGGLDEIKPGNLLRMFNTQTRKRTARNSFENCLRVAAEQFILKTKGDGKSRKNNRTDVIASYQLYRRGGRDAFIAIPGLSLATGDLKSFKAVLDTMLSSRKGPFFPFWENSDAEASYEAMDAPLWFFWAVQQYTAELGDKSAVWKSYGTAMHEILDAYRQGTDYNIRMREDGLLEGGVEGKALTWMNAYVNGKPVTPRVGMPIEINALWYNAIKFTLEIAGPRSTEGKKFIAEWKNIPALIEKSFEATYWDEYKGYLADNVNGTEKDWSNRPNQILAVALPYTPLREKVRKSVLEVVKKELLTRRGLRSLSPRHPDYKGRFGGTLEQRNRAYHQGCVWPWLLGYYVDVYLKIYQREVLPEVISLYQGFEEVMSEYGISTISEIYEGDPPHQPKGVISQAWNVAEIIRMGKIIKDFDQATQPVTI